MSSTDVRSVLEKIEDTEGDEGRDTSELFRILYGNLHAMAKRQFAREGPGQTLQPTALVNEAYVKLLGSHQPVWKYRRHFFAAAANAMRQILIDRARSKACHKRGRGFDRVPLDQIDDWIADEGRGLDLIALDAALKELEADDERKGAMVNLKYFAGLTTAETAQALDVSVATVEREWSYVRRWLYLKLRSSTGDSE